MLNAGEKRLTQVRTVFLYFVILFRDLKNYVNLQKRYSQISV